MLKLLTSIHMMHVDLGGIMSESRNARFRRLAQSRGDRLIREINLLGNLANKNNYSYTEEEVLSLFEPIEKELRETREKFFPNARQHRKVQFE